MKPTSITANREKKEMSVVWDDGHTSSYPFSLLRAGCPCADCRGGHDRMGNLPDPAVFGTSLPDSPAARLPCLGGRARLRDLPLGLFAGALSLRAVQTDLFLYAFERR